MRRFLIWTALVVVVGLVLAIGGAWAYQHFYARFQPVTVTRDQTAIQGLLDQASWVSSGGGGDPVYVIGYRDSAALQRFEREETPRLRAAGREVRFILFARPDREGLAQSTAAERATVAELWLTRDWGLYQRWAATPVRNWTAAGIPAADGSLARGAVVEAGRTFAAELSEKLDANGLDPSYPLVLWRDQQGFLKACACTDPRSWPFLRDDVGAPDRMDPPAVAQPPVAEAGPAAPNSLPYPELAPAAPVPGQAAPAPGNAPPPAAGAAPGTAPAARPAPRPAAPPATRTTPQPKQQDDSTFF